MPDMENNNQPMGEIDPQVKAEIIAAVKKKGLGRAVQSKGAEPVASEIRVFDVTYDNVEIKPTSPPHSTEPYDMKWLDDLWQSKYFDPNTNGFNPEFVKITSAFLFGVLGFFAGKVFPINQPGAREAIGFVGAALLGERFAREYLLAITSRRKTYEEHYTCRFKNPDTMESGCELEKAEYIEQVDVTVKYVRTAFKKGDGYGEFNISRPIQVDCEARSHLRAWSRKKIPSTTTYNAIADKLMRLAEKQPQKDFVMELENLLSEVMASDNGDSQQHLERADQIAQNMQDAGLPAVEPTKEMTVKEFLVDVEPNLETLRGDKPAIYFMGPTGSGKSSLINQLKGLNLAVSGYNFMLPEEVKRLTWNPSNPPYAPMGDDPMATKTTWVTVYKGREQGAGQSPLMLADCPGFANRDGRKKKQDEFALFLASKMNTNMKGIAVVINASDILAKNMDLLKELIDDLDRVLIDKALLRGHIVFIVNAHGMADVNTEVRKNLSFFKKKYQKIKDDYERNEKRLRGAMADYPDLDKEYHALKGQADKQKTIVERIKEKVWKKLDNIGNIIKDWEDGRQAYEDALKKLNFLDFMVIETGEQSNLLVGNIADQSFISAVEAKLLKFEKLTQLVADVFCFNPKPFEQLFSGYLYDMLSQINFFNMQLERNRAELKQLEDIDNETYVDDVAGKFAEQLSSVKQKLETLQGYQTVVVHYPLMLNNRNLSWGLYASFAVKSPAAGNFTHIELKPHIMVGKVKYSVLPVTATDKNKTLALSFPGDVSRQFDFNELVSLKLLSATAIPENALVYQSDTSGLTTPAVPTESVGNLMGLKVLKPGVQLEFNIFRDGLISVYDQLDLLIRNNKWLADIDSELYCDLSQAIGGLKLIIADKKHNEENYLDGAVKQFQVVQKLLTSLHQKFTPSVRERLKKQLKDSKIQQQGLRDKKELLQDARELERKLQAEKEGKDEWCTRLDGIQETLGSPVFQFALDILHGKAPRPILESRPAVAFAASVMETDQSIPETVSKWLVPATVASSAAFYQFKSSKTTRASQAGTYRDTYSTSATSSIVSQSWPVKTTRLPVVTMSNQTTTMPAARLFFTSHPSAVASRLLPLADGINRTLRLLKR